MMRYHMGWLDEGLQPSASGHGKRIRPVLCLLACEASGGDFHIALPAAAAVELLHNFTLIHDDIEDASTHRRHRHTVWKLWGVPQAINAGDGMFAVAHLALLEIAKSPLFPRVVVDLLQVFERTILKVCEGQFLDLSYEARLDVTVDEYIGMIECKTAALIECAMRMGAMTAPEGALTAGHLAEAGRLLGLAFQAKDDELGVWGEEQATGKPSGGDIHQRKKGLPVVYAFEKAEGDEKARLLDIYSQDKVSPGDVGEVISILDRLGARAYCLETARSYYRQAVDELDKGRRLEGSTAHDKLRLIAESLVERSF